MTAATASAPVPTKGESKHERFLRLMQKRLGRSLDELRLVAQLSSTNYENTQEEAQEVIKHLDDAVHHIAQVYGVPYSTAIGAAAQRAAASGHLVTKTRAGKIDEVDIAKAIDLIRHDKASEAADLLRSVLLGERA